MIQEFLDTIGKSLHFDEAPLSFCTQYSWYGVVKKDRLGIEGLYLTYNRIAAQLSPNFLTFRVERPGGGSERQRDRTDLPLSIEESDSKGFSGTLAFLQDDLLCYHASIDQESNVAYVRATLLLPETKPSFEREVTYKASERRLIIETRTPRTDGRDPDPDHPLTVCVNVPEAFTRVSFISEGQDASGTEGEFSVKTDGAVVITFTASGKDFAGVQTFVVGIGEGETASRIASRMAALGDVSPHTSSRASMGWLTKALDKFSFDGIPQNLRQHYAKAAYQILSNTKTPRGKIHRYAVFPSRGRYTAHYLWDACFTNLGVEQFNERLAADFLLALCENQEEDGKMPQFISATWNRPGESQPPLITWSAWRLYEKFGNKEFIRDVYGPLCKMVDWWFTNRDQDGDGVVEYCAPLESGWDDSPRWDKGRVAAVELNSFLNREVRLLAKMAALLAKPDDEQKWNQKAGDHAKRMYNRLFDPEDGVFYDRLVSEDRLWKVLTPASFMPLWTGVPLSRELSYEMIAKYLINPKHFFGSRPFPVVAYSDKHYQPNKWWRGPVWPNIAWAMCEALRINGFENERREAIRRLIEMMTKSDELNELYSSSTGEPLGAPGLCWGNAVFMELAKEYGGIE